MDPDCVSLREFLEPAASILDAFEFEKMRYKWRQWVIYPANWKTSIEAFMEPYHVAGTHTQLLKYGQFYAYSQGLRPARRQRLRRARHEHEDESEQLGHARGHRR